MKKTNQLTFIVTFTIFAAIGVLLVENSGACPACRGIVTVPEISAITEESKPGVMEEISRGFTQLMVEIEQQRVQFLTLLEMIPVGKAG